MEGLLDEIVGRKVWAFIQRGGADEVHLIEVQDLHDLSPSALLDAGGPELQQPPPQLGDSSGGISRDEARQVAVKPPAVILCEPQLGENIGTAARAMANFGLTDLRIVNPRDGWPSEKARAAASRRQREGGGLRDLPAETVGGPDSNETKATPVVRENPEGHVHTANIIRGAEIRIPNHSA